MSAAWAEAQTILKARGYSLGSGGPHHDGIDGDPGDLTAGAVLAELRKSMPPVPVPAPAVTVASAAGDAHLTVNQVLELAHYEAIVREWYLDSENIGTWAIGVTNRSGHNVDRYKDNPQTLERCIEVSVWLMQTRYLPDVLAEFAGHAMTEAQIAAALSFHYNTGAIKTTSWVDLWLAGRLDESRRFLESHYLNGGDLTARRKAEAALFFDGVWANDGTTTVWPVKKPSYKPDWAHGSKVNIRPIVEAVLA
jgi:GH24 family phage-related lysozyme (muramidase)